MKRLFTEEQANELVELYNNGNTATQIAEMYSTNRHTISKYLKEKGVQVNNGRFKNKHNFNRNFFKEIDTEEKAYVLGFIFADGNITRGDTFQLCLSEVDIDILEKINAAMDSSYPIYYRPAHGGYANSKPQRYIRMTSKDLYNDLFKLDMIKKETAINAVPDHLYHHFVRGVFDGDGTISNYKRKGECEFYIMANDTLLNEIITFFNSKEVYFKEPKYNRGISKIRKGGSNNIKKIYNILYKDATIYLDRKYNKWGEIINESNK